MVLVVDESVDRQVVEALKQLHDVHDIATTDCGVDDDRVLRIARNRDAVLVTADKDFGELVYRQRKIHRGVILTRLSGMEPNRKAELVVRALANNLTGNDARAFVVISPNGVRIRPPVF